jgi:hypothetical protein
MLKVYGQFRLLPVHLKLTNLLLWSNQMPVLAF